MYCLFQTIQQGTQNSIGRLKPLNQLRKNLFNQFSQQPHLDLVSKFERLQSSYEREISKNNTLSDRLESVISENRVLRNVAENYERVCHAYGPERVATIVEAVKRQEQAEKEQKRGFRQRHDRVSR